MTHAFDAGGLMSAAQCKESLDDRVPVPFEEPLAVLADSYSAANLNDIGVHILRSSLIHCLRMRLRAEEWIRRNPEITDESIIGQLQGCGREENRRRD